MHFDLAALRKSANLTQAEVAERLGIPRDRIGRLERGIGSLKTFAAAVTTLGGTMPCLRTVRLRTGMSARELARRIGTTHSVISVMEHEGRGSVGTWLAALDVLAHDIPGCELRCGDALDILKHVTTGGVQVVCTSPPYWQQKRYPSGGIGNEETCEQYLDALDAVFLECRRILSKDGSLWINVGDTYLNKTALRIHSRLADRLTAQGWLLRQELIWSRGRSPQTATDRFRQTHEHLLWFVKRRTGFYFDPDPVRVPYADGGRLPDPETQRQKITQAIALTETEKENALAELERRVLEGRDYRVRVRGEMPDNRNGIRPSRRERAFAKHGVYFNDVHPDGAIPGSVWHIAPTGDDVHPSVFPEELVRRCIEATSKPGYVILDPFAGSGTVAVVARRLGRRAIAIDIAPEYIQRTRVRLLSE